MPYVITTETVYVDAEPIERPRTIEGNVTLPAVAVKRPARPLVGDHDGMDRGHIVAESLGGPNTSDNVVPMQPTFHQLGGVWRRLEQRLEGIKKDYGVVSLRIEVVYNDAMDELVPAGFRVTARCGDDVADLDVYFHTHKLENYYIAHDAVLPQQVDVSTHPLAIAIREAQTVIDTTNWVVENDVSFNGRNPVVAHSSFARPYAVLDYLWITDNPALTDELGKFTPQRYMNFTQRQKQLIYLVNRLRNNGWLRSDYDGDLQAPLPCDVGGRGAAQVDHVLCENSGGVNLFSNARVCSGKFNNKVRNKSPQDKMGYVI